MAFKDPFSDMDSIFLESWWIPGGYLIDLEEDYLDEDSGKEKFNAGVPSLVDFEKKEFLYMEKIWNLPPFDPIRSCKYIMSPKNTFKKNPKNPLLDKMYN